MHPSLSCICPCELGCCQRNSSNVSCVICCVMNISAWLSQNMIYVHLHCKWYGSKQFRRKLPQRWRSFLFFSHVQVWLLSDQNQSRQSTFQMDYESVAPTMNLNAGRK